ncbi:MAG: VIT domain-containing protein, partial [Bacteroidales bacterium]
MQTKIRLTIALLFTAILSVQAQNTLWINNPQYTWYWQQGVITEATLTVRPAGLYLQYGLYLTYSASQTNFNAEDKLEVVQDFDLPAGAIVLDSWLWVGDDIVQGRLIDRWSASDIYEGIVNRRQDPSVLYKNGASHYQLRVYPITKNETRKVKITYLVPVTPLQGRVEAGLPSWLLMASNPDPGLHLFVWEDNGFANPTLHSVSETLSPGYDEEFGAFLRAYLPASDVVKHPTIQMDLPASNGVFLSLFDGPDAGYYQLSLNPGDFINLPTGQKLLVILDYLPGNTATDKEVLA